MGVCFILNNIDRVRRIQSGICSVWLNTRVFAVEHATHTHIHTHTHTRERFNRVQEFKSSRERLREREFKRVQESSRDNNARRGESAPKHNTRILHARETPLRGEERRGEERRGEERRGEERRGKERRGEERRGESAPEHNAIIQRRFACVSGRCRRSGGGDVEPNEECWPCARIRRPQTSDWPGWTDAAGSSVA
jgi:hypothetical protein